MNLRGLTWDHPRGYAPLIQGAKEYSKQNRGIEIQWDRRTLREFGEASIDQYLDRYDLVIVDHPLPAVTNGASKSDRSPSVNLCP